jgi:hypothetical protein
MIPHRQFVKARLRGLLQWVGAVAGKVPNSELLYADAFRGAAAALGVALPPLYPLGAAANYSLLYVVLRAMTETPASRVLDIGVGQTTKLLDSIAKVRPIDVVSIESDRDWATRIATTVAHPVLISSLVVRTVRRQEALCFDSTNITGHFNAVIVDGPMGSRRRSRWGVLEILDRCLAEDFLVIFDDASRRGELDTVREFVRSHAGRVRTRFVHAGKSQCLVYTTRFSEAGVF